MAHGTIVSAIIKNGETYYFSIEKNGEVLDRLKPII